MQIEESRRQFDVIRGLMQPYVDAGTGALSGQLNLIGINGQDAQRTAIEGLQNGSQFRALTQQGEEAILANAAATGGLRGGNVQGALAQYRPAMLQGLIDRQLGNLGGIASLGQNAAAGVGNAAQNTGAQVNAALGDQGAAQAGAALARGQANSNLFGAIGGAAGQFFGQGGGINIGRPGSLFGGNSWGF
ncbi:MAG: hypothetical protein U5N55_04905 [Cypionkella sp.]|nr:hypothetical protein [Cypionkella sp.]